MPNAIANLAHLSFVAETTFGGALSATALKQLRILSESLALNKNVAPSGEMDVAGRNRVAVIETNKAAGGSIEMELSFTDLELLIRAAIGASITGATAAAGANYFNGNTLSSFYIEKAFTDVARYIGVYGAVIEQLDLAFVANQPATATLQIMAQKADSLAATRGASYTAPSTDAVMRSGVDVSNLTLGGSPIAAAVRALRLSIKNNLKPTDQLNSEVPSGFTFGNFEVTGRDDPRSDPGPEQPGAFREDRERRRRLHVQPAGRPPDRRNSVDPRPGPGRSSGNPVHRPQGDALRHALHDRGERRSRRLLSRRPCSLRSVVQPGRTSDP
jgi:hypothetical protein